MKGRVMTNLKDWFIGTTRRVTGELIERHYGYFVHVISGRIVHASSIKELEQEIKQILPAKQS
ncbi:hypothetical protein IJJ27_04395 [bacterium]|nr:hypothetical protein [bacterium]